MAVTMLEPAYRPSPKAKWLWAINAALIWVVALVAEVVWGLVDRSMAGWHAVVLAATLMLAAVHITVVPFWRYAVHRWEVSDTAVYTRTGWFNQERRIAPISRVQTVDTQRGPMDRLLGLATVTVTTASAAGAVEITALDLAVADRTVARLTEIAGSTEEDAT
ncbi:MAG: PH domain-containing protein [Aldersonia sp.]|nr:PH domain-containing protein [Aldersonia sp.]